MMYYWELSLQGHGHAEDRKW